MQENWNQPIKLKMEWENIYEIYHGVRIEDTNGLIRICKDRQHNGKLYIHDINQKIQQNRY
jgi:hypothetical protein